tara:strand:+ start:423 stop:641 length:219 start_codon:yes stop_codon:yes gene_type:complete
MIQVGYTKTSDSEVVEKTVQGASAANTALANLKEEKASDDSVVKVWLAMQRFTDENGDLVDAYWDIYAEIDM